MTSPGEEQMSFDDLAVDLEPPAPAWSDADTAAVRQEAGQEPAR